uniref:T9SS type A sorting domain-containing protein n=1 Tax=candidate division WOR-3 bacterium TaxID=2052148 RepID=A0A7C4GJU3_UNCW3
MRAVAIGLLCLGVLGGSILSAQSYRCDWGVNGIGGGEMSGAGYRCGATAGQTAVGMMTGTDYLVLIGFWQGDYQTGIRDEEHGPAVGPLLTRLEAVLPNPFRSGTVVRYVLGAEELVSVTVHDLTGRQVRRLVSGQQLPGRYTVRWQGEDDMGRLLGNGIYFCRFAAGETRSTRKLILAR